MMHWLTALICGSLAYALADILCDEVISESDTSSIDTPDDEEPAGPPSVAGFPVSPGTPGYRVLAQETPGGVEPALRIVGRWRRPHIASRTKSSRGS